MGEIKQITTGRGRKYVHVADDGTETTVPSVTTILGGALPKPGLEYWGAKLALQYASAVGVKHGVDVEELYAVYKTTEFSPYKALRKAGSRGTDVHEVAEVLLRDGTLPDLPSNTEAGEGYIDALVKWHEAFDVSSWSVEHVEARMFSTEYLFAGTTDFIARRPDGVWIVGDFKSSKGLYQSHHLQVAAYMHAAKEMGLVPEDAEVEGHVIRLGADGEFEVERTACNVTDFAKVLDVYRVLNDKSRKPVKL